MLWPNEKVDRLRALVADPRCLYASEIAAELGMSRRAVIGKCYRLKLKLPNAGHFHSFAKVRKARTTALQPDIAAGTTALLDLEPHMCRWPYGERAPYFFCGMGKLAGSSYCPSHTAQAWSAGAPRGERSVAPFWKPRRAA